MVRPHRSAEEAAGFAGPSDGVLEAVDDRTCLLRTGADGLDALVVPVLLLGVDFEVVEPAGRRGICGTGSAGRSPRARGATGAREGARRRGEWTEPMAELWGNGESGGAASILPAGVTGFIEWRFPPPARIAFSGSRELPDRYPRGRPVLPVRVKQFE